MHHWRDVDHERLVQVQTFEEMFDIALPMLERISKPAVQVCGPISTGGVGTIEGNVRILEEAMRRVHEKGISVFNQLPFERSMSRLAVPWDERREYCEPILEVFYRRVFASGHLSGTMFLPNWETSYGARWERRFAPTHGIEVVDIPLEWIADLLPPVPAG